MATICDVVAELALDAGLAANLPAVEMQQLRKLAADPRENLPYLDRIRGALQGDPLMRDHDAFIEFAAIVENRLEMPQLAKRLREAIEMHGGLISRAEALAQFELCLKSRSNASVH